jgi:hypothetical protein
MYRSNFGHPNFEVVQGGRWQDVAGKLQYGVESERVADPRAAAGVLVNQFNGQVQTVGTMP